MFQTQIGLIRKVRISAVFAGMFLFVLSLLAVFPVASSVDDTLAANQQSETTLTLSTEDLDLDFGIGSIDGSFSQASASVSVTTNNYTGYTLSINTSNTGEDAGKLVGTEKSFNSISTATSESDFTASTDYNGLWGYKPSIIDGEANADYLPVPTEVTTIEETDSANAEANVYTIGLGARADFSYNAGAYTNAFVITGVGNPVTYTIVYDKNTEDTVTNMPETQTGVTSGTYITLASDIPERLNNAFVGWCEGETNIGSCDGVVYQPGDEYMIYQTTDDPVVLRALWGVTFDMAYEYENKNKDISTDKYTMQDMTISICGMVTEGQTTTLVDIRDGNIYHVVKTPDHRCWLADNLALDILDSDVQSILSTENTNIDSYTLDALKSGNRKEGDNYAYSGPKKSSSNNHKIYTPNINNDYKDISRRDIANPKDDLEAADDWKFGIYYNVCAASAGSFCYGDSSSAGKGYDDENTALDIEYDICPAGWRMPTGGKTEAYGGQAGGGEYQILFNSITGLDVENYDYASVDAYTTFRTIMRLPLSGLENAGTVSGQGAFSYSWSATSGRLNSGNMYNSYVGLSDDGEMLIYPTAVNYTNTRDYGFSLRCVAENKYKIVYDWGSNYAKNVTTRIMPGDTLGNTIPLNPTRDGYVFVGWYTEATGGIQVDLNTIPSGDETYYAHWNASVTFDDAFAAAGKTRDTVSNKYIMQDMTPSICDAVSDEQTTTLVDIRDGNIYSIIKALDHRCWLTDNLALNPLADNVTLNDINTNASFSAVDNFYNGGNVGNHSGWTSDKVGRVGNSSSSTSFTYYAYFNVDNKDNVPEEQSPLGELARAENWKIGVYYNYCAASMGTYCYQPNSGVDENQYSAIDAVYDVCPAGWRMPTGGKTEIDGGQKDGGEYQILYNNYMFDGGMVNRYSKFRKDMRIPLSGQFINGALETNSSYFWSSTHYSSSSINNLEITTAFGVRPAAYQPRGNGGFDSVRCVADNRYRAIFDLNGGNINDSFESVDVRIMPGDALGDIIPTPTRDGYEFVGWYTDAVGGTQITADTVPSGKSVFEYYAHWIPSSIVSFDDAFAAAGKTRDTVSNKYIMQDMNSTICDAVSDEQTTTLVDIRDGTIYNIVKALDHRCWLADNLALDLTDATILSNIDESNTNASNTTLEYLKGISVRNTSTERYGNYATAGVTDWVDSYSYSAPLINKVSKDLTVSGLTETDETITDAGGWKFGIYYNYCAASAGNYCYGDGTSYVTTPKDISKTAIDTEYDICPSGWRMPTGDTYDATNRPDGGEYQTLFNMYPSTRGGDGYTRLRESLRFPLSGIVGREGTAIRQGLSGSAWSSTFKKFSNSTSSPISMYILSVDSTSVRPQGYSERTIGNTVRCVAK